MTDKNEKVPQVVVVGAGFGGLRAARALANAPVEVTLIDRNNYHLFQPLLYQVATAGLSTGDIAYPVRGILKKQNNLSFMLGEVEAVDLHKKQIRTSQTEISFDYLILAVGSETNFFNNSSLQQNSFGLKDLKDAQSIRNHILNQFEKALFEKDEERKNALLTFVIVGGGPTGVELAGAIAELMRVMKKDYPTIDHNLVQVILLEALDKLLINFDSVSSQATKNALIKKGVQVRLNTMVESYDGEVIKLKGDENLHSHTLIWAAGVKATNLMKEFSQEKLPQSRVRVLPTLQIPQDETVFLIGDAAYLPDENGQPLPMVAPVAMQQAEHAVDNLTRLLNHKPLEEFKYKDLGSMATIGRNQAVAELFGLKLRGWLAWVTWLFVHLMQLVGFRNRIVVLVNWAWQYIFYDRAVRLIERGACDFPDTSNT